MGRAWEAGGSHSLGQAADQYLTAFLRPCPLFLSTTTHTGRVPQACSHCVQLWHDHCHDPCVLPGSCHTARHQAAGYLHTHRQGGSVRGWSGFGWAVCKLLSLTLSVNNLWEKSCHRCCHRRQVTLPPQRCHLNATPTSESSPWQFSRQFNNLVQSVAACHPPAAAAALSALSCRPLQPPWVRWCSSCCLPGSLRRLCLCLWCSSLAS